MTFVKGKWDRLLHREYMYAKVREIIIDPVALSFDVNIHTYFPSEKIKLQIFLAYEMIWER